MHIVIRSRLSTPPPPKSVLSTAKYVTCARKRHFVIVHNPPPPRPNVPLFPLDDYVNIEGKRQLNSLDDRQVRAQLQIFQRLLQSRITSMQSKAATS